MFESDQFQVNETWIVLQLNEIPISTETNGDFNLIALMDAASCYILGTELVPVDSAEPSQLESKRLLNAGKSQARQFPKTLIIPDNQVADILSAEAEYCGIEIVRAPEDHPLIFISEAREGFQEHVGKGGMH
jgi:hypothetical protein